MVQASVLVDKGASRLGDWRPATVQFHSSFDIPYLIISFVTCQIGRLSVTYYLSKFLLPMNSIYVRAHRSAEFHERYKQVSPGQQSLRTRTRAQIENRH